MIKSISDKIIAIEKELNPSSFNFRGENVWPVIRIAIYLSSTKSTSQSNIPIFKRINFLLGGAWYYFKNNLLQPSKTKYEVVLVTTSHYKVSEQGKVYDRIIDPILKYLESKVKRFKVWEFTGKYKYDEKISYEDHLRPLHQEVYFLAFIKRIYSKAASKDKLMGDVEALNKLLKLNSINFIIDAQFINKLELIFMQADFFERILRKKAVRHLFIVCYYDVKCFSFMLAANRIGIKTIDLQHGVQGKQHMAYSQWPEVVIRDTKFLPSHFYVWDKNSFDSINKWKNDANKILVGSNKWFEDRAKKISNDIILLSLQPLDDFLPEYVINLIRQYGGSKKWYVRLHPRQMNDIDKVMELFNSYGLAEKVDVYKASLSPLTELLQHTSLHVTFYSSVAIEASYYGIPTYFLNEKGLSFFTDYLNDNLTFYYPKHDFNEIVNQADKLNVIADKVNDRISVLDHFLNEE